MSVMKEDALAKPNSSFSAALACSDCIACSKMMILSLVQLFNMFIMITIWRNIGDNYTEWISAINFNNNYRWSSVKTVTVIVKLWALRLSSWHTRSIRCPLLKQLIMIGKNGNTFDCGPVSKEKECFSLVIKKTKRKIMNNWQTENLKMKLREIWKKESTNLWQIKYQSCKCLFSIHSKCLTEMNKEEPTDGENTKQKLPQQLKIA